MRIRPINIGIFGGGQLGRMLAQAALPLGIHCTFLDDADHCPAQSLGRVFKSHELDQFIQGADTFSLEFENTPVADAQQVAQQKPIFPPVGALYTAQNRLREKAMFDALNIPVPAYVAVHSLADLKSAALQLGLPLVLKTAMGGYDGKGQFVVKSTDDITLAWESLGKTAPLIAEAFVPFEREVSIIAVRAQNGAVKTWSLAQNFHHGGILSHSIVPAPESEHLLPVAQDYITRVLNHLNYVGVLTLELFVTATGLLANEIAPRVHNSGHWTIEGASTSQFENHMRAVAALPLGNTTQIQPCAMVNIIGTHPKPADILALPDTHLHLYGKAERPGRKLGHITVLADHPDQLQQQLKQLAQVLPNPMALPV